MTTALFTLRAFQMGLKMADLECLTFGDVIDMFTENGNDSYEWKELANASDFDKF